MHLPAFVVFALMFLCPTFAAAQATLNKCIDTQGAITYTNKPCGSARETLKVEIDPAPIPDRPRIEPAQVQPSQPIVVKPLPATAHAPSPAPATIQLKTKRAPAKAAQSHSARECDTLSDKLGRVLDKMDLARRKGYSQEQMNAWNEETRELERKKQQSGCF